MANVNVVVECLCFHIPGMMGAFGVQGLTRMNLATMQAAGLGGITGISSLIDTSEHVCIKIQGLPYNATQRDNGFFDGLNIMPNDIHIVMETTNHPIGEAFVEFNLLMKLSVEWIVITKTLG
jgi:heterogeneous nuclear ribonucleoprotein F/H/epithelial splicing regulatory protein 1/2